MSEFREFAISWAAAARMHLRAGATRAMAPARGVRQAVVLSQHVRDQLGSYCSGFADVTSKAGGWVQDRRAPLDVFVGRTAELAQMAEVIARVETGQPWLVAVEGDPGVGKTSLVRRGLAEAAGLRVLQARASLAEADLDFGIVDQLLRTAGGLSPAITLTNGAGSSASSFAVGARLLEVVGEQQAAGAVAVVIDDLQWADRKSVEALTFMLRRLSVDPVIAIVTYRGPGGRLDDAAQRMLVPPIRPVPGRRGIAILTSRGARLSGVSRVVPENLSIAPFRCVRRPLFSQTSWPRRATPGRADNSDQPAYCAVPGHT